MSYTSRSTIYITVIRVICLQEGEPSEFLLTDAVDYLLALRHQYP